MANKANYVELGLTCANVCKALARGMNEKKLDEISKSVSEAINQLTTWVKPAVHDFDDFIDGTLYRRTVAEIERKIIKQRGRNPISRLFNAKSDKETIATWKVELNGILHVFNVRSLRFSWLSLTGPYRPSWL